MRHPACDTANRRLACSRPPADERRQLGAHFRRLACELLEQRRLLTVFFHDDFGQGPQPEWELTSEGNGSWDITAEYSVEEDTLGVDGHGLPFGLETDSQTLYLNEAVFSTDVSGFVRCSVAFSVIQYHSNRTQHTRITMIRDTDELSSQSGPRLSESTNDNRRSTITEISSCLSA